MNISIYDIQSPFLVSANEDISTYPLIMPNNTPVLGYLRRPDREDINEIPSVLIYQAISNRLVAINAIFQLYTAKTIYRRTYSNILKVFGSRYDRFTGLLKYVVKTTDSENTYYVCPGIILNSDLKPLLLYTMNVSNRASLDPNTTTPNVIIKNCTVRISPAIYEESKSLKRLIVDNLIPAIINSSICTDVPTERAKPRVVIEDIDDWITRVTEPADIMNFPDQVKDFLSSDTIIKEVLNNI